MLSSIILFIYRYIYSAKHIKNKPTKNMIVTQASIIRELQLENEELKQKLCQNWEKNGMNISYIEYDHLSVYLLLLVFKN